MAKYNFIYCNKCEDFKLNSSVDFGDNSITCPRCFSKNIKKFSCDSFYEMAKIERNYKISKIIKK